MDIKECGWDFLYKYMPKELTTEQVLNLSINLRKIQLFGMAIEYAGLEILDYMPTTNIKSKCTTLINASDNFMKSFKNKMGESAFSEMLGLADDDYEQVGEKWHFINSILLSDKNKFTEIKDRLKGCVDDLQTTEK